MTSRGTRQIDVFGRVYMTTRTAHHSWMGQRIDVLLCVRMCAWAYAKVMWWTGRENGRHDIRGQQYELGEGQLCRSSVCPCASAPFWTRYSTLPVVETWGITVPAKNAVVNVIPFATEQGPYVTLGLNMSSVSSTQYGWRCVHTCVSGNRLSRLAII